MSALKRFILAVAVLAASVGLSGSPALADGSVSGPICWWNAENTGLVSTRTGYFYSRVTNEGCVAGYEIRHAVVLDSNVPGVPNWTSFPETVGNYSISVINGWATNQDYWGAMIRTTVVVCPVGGAPSTCSFPWVL